MKAIKPPPSFTSTTVPEYRRTDLTLIEVGLQLDYLSQDTSCQFTLLRTWADRTFDPDTSFPIAINLLILREVHYISFPRYRFDNRRRLARVDSIVTFRRTSAREEVSQAFLTRVELLRPYAAFCTFKFFQVMSVVRVRVPDRDGWERAYWILGGGG